MPTTTNTRRIRINPTAVPLVQEVTWEDLDPAEQAVAEEVLTRMKAEFAVAAAATIDDETTPFGRFLATRAPASRTAVRANTRSLQAAPEAVLAKNFGRHVALVRPVVVNPAHRPRLKFDLPPELEAQIKAAIAKKKAEKAAAEAAAQAAANDLAAGLKYTRMRMTITKVAWSPSPESEAVRRVLDGGTGHRPARQREQCRRVRGDDRRRRRRGGPPQSSLRQLEAPHRGHLAQGLHRRALCRGEGRRGLRAVPS